MSHLPGTALPSTVDANCTLQANHTMATHQRKCFYCHGRFWVFYSNGVDGLWRTSVDGITWTAAQIACPFNNNGWNFSVAYDEINDYFHVIYGSAVNTLNYRRGTPDNNGNLALTAPSTFVKANLMYTPSIAVDDQGYVWVGYSYFDGVGRVPYATQNAKNDGTWLTGTDQQLNATRDNTWRVAMVKLGGTAIAAVYARQSNTVRVTIWTGSVWNAEVASAGSVAAISNNLVPISATNDLSDVLVAYRKLTSNDIVYFKVLYASNTIVNESTVFAALTNATGSPTISVDTAGRIYVVWTEYPTANHVFLNTKPRADTVWPATQIDLANETVDTLNQSGETPSLSYKAFGLAIGLAYGTMVVSPWKVKFLWFNPIAAQIGDGLSWVSS